MMNPHTIKRMKSEALLTRLADREARETWEKKGSLDTHARAMQRVRETLVHESTAQFTEDVEQRIRTQFPELVPGKLELPQGL
jgi:trimethylamine:corrinoid methyltransferase-like protein